MNIMQPSNFNQRTHPPRLLKDFLTEDSNRHHSSSTVRPPLNAGDKQTHFRSVTISAFHSMLKALRNTQFIKSSLRRSNTICGGGTDVHRQITDTQITIKDIIRWKSFRDISGDGDYNETLPPSPQYQCTTTTTTTTSPCSSSGSSWCGSDFTAENLPCWGDSKSEEREKCLRRVGEETLGPKKDPISVMEITFEEDWWNSSFDQSVQRINLEKRMPTTTTFAITDANHQRISPKHENTDLIYLEEEMEEKAMQLLNHVKEESEKRLIIDLFREEVTPSRMRKEEEMVKRVKEWINGEDKLWIGWAKKDVCVREIEKEHVTKVEEEQEEIGMEVENEIVDVLVDELLLHLVISSYSS
ncbi:hypothetical protein M5689_005178 [Euphorbia peplus]|nr:hypothetical protein M5689_005178 [Euphorbia peplus]